MAAEHEVATHGVKIANLEVAFGGLQAEMREGFSGLHKTIEAKSTPQYQLYGIVAAICISSGGFLWLIVTERQDSANNHLTEKMEMVKDYDMEFRRLFTADLASLKEKVITKDLWGERRESVNASLVDQSRRIEELREDHQGLSNSLGNGGDSISELRSRVKQLESAIAQPR